MKSNGLKLLGVAAIGAAFNNIVKSLVDGVIMPPIGWLAGGIDFSRYAWVLREDDPATRTVERVAIQHGAFRGYANGCFYPDAVATRAQLAKVLVNATR